MMGFGLMGAGAAVSGLVEGYQKGKKFAQDEERFDMEKERFGLEKAAADRRRRLDEEQIKGAGLLNRKAEGELGDIEYNRSVEADERAIVERYAPLLNGASQAPAAPPSAASVPGAIPDPAAGSSAPEAVATPGGIPVPGQQPAQPPKSRFEVMRDMNTELLNNRLRMRGVDRGAILKQAIESARFFSRAETQTTMDALNAFQSGVPQERIFSDLAAQGVQVQPGTAFAIVEKKDERTGVPFQDVELRLPGGRVISKDKLAEGSLDPKQMFDIRTEIGRLNLTASHYAAMEQQAKADAKDRREQAERHHSQTMARINEQIRQQADLYKLNFEKFQWDKFVQDQGRAQTQFERLFQYTPLTEDVRLKLENQGNPGDPKKGIQSDLEKAEARTAAASRAVSGAMVIYGMNIDPRTLKPSATPAEVKSAVDVLIKSKEKPELLKRDDMNRAYVEVGSNKVFVPAPNDPAPAPAPAAAPAPAPAGVTKPAAAPAPTGPGIPNPSNPYVDARGNRIPNPPPGPGSVMSTTIAPAVTRAAQAATQAVSEYGMSAPVDYLKGKIARGEKLSVTEEVRARQYGLLK